ncbi:MAG: pyruvate dehydrogenase complex dihydrolipoamide acetyltransferase [Hyphomicrobiales bacterium]
MAIKITMPALSPTMESGTLAKWLVKEGDDITSGDIIAEIETDKATMEVEAVDEGKVGKLLVDAGSEDVKVNEVIAILLEEGEDESAIDAAASAPPSAAAPAAEPVAAAAPASPSPAPVAPASAAPSAAAPVQSGARVFASPLARRIASQEGVDITSVSGTGPHGRIVKRDVESALAAGTAKAPAAAPAADAPRMLATTPSADAVMAMYKEGTYEVVPHDGMRKIIAERLTEAKQTIPHFYLTLDVCLDELLGLRKEINDRAPKDADGKPSYKVSVNDFIIKALGVALQRVPDANVTYTEAVMLKHKQSDVGVAVAIPGGLLTPVVRNVESKGLAAISNEMKDYAARARSRKLMPEEYQGGTTAVSNLGMFGIKNFSAVINPPHATILAVGGGEKRGVIEGDEMVIKTMMSVTLSTDHRAVDGALGAEFLNAFKNCIEAPALMLV